MADYRFKISPIPISELEAFREASAEELRVLIAIQDRLGVFSDSEIIRLCGVSAARFNSALTLWQQAGAIIPIIGSEQSCIVEEFPISSLHEDFFEQGAAEVAKDIRDNELHALINECQQMLGKSQLSPQEVKLLTGLNTQYGLCPEYILLLATHLNGKEGTKFTLHKLALRCRSLANNGIDTVDELDEYIKKAESASSIQSQIKLLFGIYGRNLTGKEKEYIQRWSELYGYDIPIITAAFDRLPAGGSMSFSYIDKILTDWYDHRCTTVAECEKRHEEYLGEKESAKSASGKTPQERRAPKKTAPRFGDFDPEEAFRRALARTYGEPADKPSGEDKK